MTYAHLPFAARDLDATIAAIRQALIISDCAPPEHQIPKREAAQLKRVLRKCQRARAELHLRWHAKHHEHPNRKKREPPQ